MRRLLDFFIHRELASEARKLGNVPLDYLRDLWQGSPRAFIAFVRAGAFLSYRARELPAAPYHVARIAATRAEDCGSCVRVAMHLAHEAGVASSTVRAAALGDVAALSPELAAVFRFADAVARADSAATEQLRPALLAAYGSRGVAALAVGIAGARTFPSLKRAMGHATSCELLAVELREAGSVR